MSEKVIKMHASVGKMVKIVLTKDNLVIEGKCISFTQPLDNDPEIASIYIERGDASLCELTEEEIEAILVID